MSTSRIDRYRDLGRLFFLYGRKDFRLELKAPEDLIEESSEEEPLHEDVAQRARAFTAKLKEMGPTFVKFGQILSTRHDIVPPEYIRELEVLQDDVEPFSFAEVEQIVEEELGVRLSKAFSEFDSQPLAAASLGQVHRASLRDGREVVVKIQRPGVKERIKEDLDIFEEMARALDRWTSLGEKMELTRTVEQARKTMLQELNYRLEAANIEMMRRNLAEFEDIYVPAVIRDYTTARVLTTEFIQGKKISRVSPLAVVDHDYSSLAKSVTHAYLKQICVDGVWHSDPHPGNIFLAEDKLVLLDFGMIGRIGMEMQDDITKLLLSVTENRGKDAAAVCLNMGLTTEGFDRRTFERDIIDFVTTYHDADLERANTGQLIFAILSVSNRNHVQLPAELAMLAKTLLHLDEITRTLDPNYNPREVIRDYAERLISQKVAQKFHPRNFYGPMLDLNELVMEFPRRAREILNQVAEGQLSVRIQVSQLDSLLQGMQRIANRITIGVIIASLIIGSSLMMQVRTRSTLFGYPSLAVIGYLIASAIGLYLIVTILWKDRRDREKARRGRLF